MKPIPRVEAGFLIVDRAGGGQRAIPTGDIAGISQENGTAGPSCLIRIQRERNTYTLQVVHWMVDLLGVLGSLHRPDQACPCCRGCSWCQGERAPGEKCACTEAG